MEHKIEKWIPIPQPVKNDFAALINKMELGDSVLLEKKESHNFVRMAWRRGYKVCTRTVDEKTRVWIVACAQKDNKVNEKGE